MIVTETPRLILRHLTWDDVDDLATIFADPVVMKFFPNTRTSEETQGSHRVDIQLLREIRLRFVGDHSQS